MKVHLRMPELEETAVEMNLIPKTGENIDVSGIRYVVVSVTHAVAPAKTTVELVKVNQDEVVHRLKLNEMVRYRTSEIRAFSPPSQPRLIR